MFEFSRSQMMKALRMDSFLLQREVAVALGVTTDTISGCEKGKYEIRDNFWALFLERMNLTEEQAIAKVKALYNLGAQPDVIIGINSYGNLILFSSAARAAARSLKQPMAPHIKEALIGYLQNRC